MTGYTGHIPSKNDRCGETQGQTLREILYVKGKHMFDKPRIPSYQYEITPDNDPNIDKRKIIFGNHSKNAENWMCGPNHMIRRQHVPGYCGHIKGIQAENMHGTTYATNTWQSFTKKHSVGIDLNIK